MSGLYLDSSALVKLVVSEPESVGLHRFLVDWPERLTSALAAVEVRRALRRARVGVAAQRRGEALLARVALIAIDDDVLQAASRVSPAELRSLDAIHLATALSLGSDLGGMIPYDERLASAARGARVSTFRPE